MSAAIYKHMYSEIAADKTVQIRYFSVSAMKIADG